MASRRVAVPSCTRNRRKEAAVHSSPRCRHDCLNIEYFLKREKTGNRLRVSRKQIPNQENFMLWKQCVHIFRLALWHMLKIPGLGWLGQKDLGQGHSGVQCYTLSLRINERKKGTKQWRGGKAGSSTDIRDPTMRSVAWRGFLLLFKNEQLSEVEIF